MFLFPHEVYGFVEKNIFNEWNYDLHVLHNNDA